MRPLLKGCSALAIATLAAGSFAEGCADNESALFVRGVLARKAPGCEAKGDPTQLMVGVGVLDMAFAAQNGGSYNAPLLVGNQMARVGNADQVRTETSRIT